MKTNETNNPLGSRVVTNLLLLGIFVVLSIMMIMMGINLIGKETVGRWLIERLEAWAASLESDTAFASGSEIRGWIFEDGEDAIPFEVPAVVLEEIQILPYDPENPVIVEEDNQISGPVLYHYFSYFRAPVQKDDGYETNKNTDQSAFWTKPTRFTFTYNGELVRHVDWNLGAWNQSEVITLTHGTQTEGRIQWENNYLDIPYGNPIQVSSCSSTMWFYTTSDGLLHFLTQMSGPETLQSVHFELCGGTKVTITDFNQPIPFGVADAYAQTYEHRWAMPLGCGFGEVAPGPCLNTWSPE